MFKNNYRLKFTPRARKDLSEIYDYIVNELYAKEAANKLLEKIKTSTMRLRDFPFSCAYVGDGFLRGKGYRKIIVDNYLVFYLVYEKEKQVVIMRVLYGRREYQGPIIVWQSSNEKMLRWAEPNGQ